MPPHHLPHCVQDLVCKRLTALIIAATPNRL
jgi:hypothetical protein